jgi:2-amino-4-hydroxy-6-hydroxymethyldihydropteridine diphosphokinase
LDSSSDGIFVLFSLGSNVGPREDNLLSALRLLEESSCVISPIISSFYETEPVGFTSQPWFLNIGVCGTTNLLPLELLDKCKSIESKIGRISRLRWHEREIDIDILLFGNHIIQSETLIIPHPLMHTRRFVLKPAAEIAADAVHPVFAKTIGRLYEECADKSVVEKVSGEF